MGYAIVIDACIARASSKESSDVVALTCSRTLDSLSENGHRLAMSKPLQDEWFKSRSQHREPYSPYASNYAFRWFYNMRSKRRVEWVELTDTVDIRVRVLFAAEPQNRELIEKDLHLVETALASDKRVISLDGNARLHFHDLGSSVAELCDILWLNPRNSNVPQWLEDGAVDQKCHRLCECR
jgi:hypothetical protein